MILYMILLILIKTIYVECGAGSALFHNRLARADCWNQDDLSKLRARKEYERLLPPLLPPDKINKKYIRDILRYFRKTLSLAGKDVDPHTATILKDALADTMGAHLRSEILPMVRFAYYAGYLPYRDTRQLHNLYDELKSYLNTQGVGWRRPARTSQWSNLTVGKILIGSGKLLDPCACLITKRDSKSCIHFPSPKLDDSDEPSAIALPFKNNELLSLMSRGSENILLKYYTTASRCILRSSPKTCRHSDFVNYNNALWHWMKRDVAPHLLDEKLYAAYGGVLRIAAAVQSYGKGLSRRNLFDVEDSGPKWHPWRMLTQSYVYVNTDWTPKLYICLVLVAALSIYLLQMCYNYMFGCSDGCHCKGYSRASSITKDVEYANVESNFPSMLPLQQSDVCYNENTHNKQSPSRKTLSLGSFTTQKVYDLNENTDKHMEVIMSDNENIYSSDSRSEELVESETSRTKQPSSPPKIESSIAQLTIEKTPSRSQNMFSTSSLTRSETYRERRTSNSDTSVTGSSTSGRSVSYTSSKSQTRRSRNSRNLAWARRVISRHCITQKSTSNTDLNYTSFTTPPSQQ